MTISVRRMRRVGWSSLLAALTVTAALLSPWVAVSAAEAGGADKSRPATFGDCPHENGGVHNGYDCEEEGGPQ
jgi:hypothetical protein